jgi:TIR domain/Pentapeptide repeats (8 copies)
MANAEHFGILRQGVEQWNQWRAGSPEIKVDLREADLFKANLRGADLRGADLRGSNLREADLSGAILRGADLSRAILGGADLSGAFLSAAELSWADLSGAVLRWADLRWAELSWAVLNDADLREADLSRADLSGASLSRADLSGASLSGASLSRADLSEAAIVLTAFADNDLSTVKGLDKVTHRGPSTIGIDTLYHSGGQIPEAFLRGCGVPDHFITYIPALVGGGQAIQFYSCFISYSSRDEEFAKRLHSRLRDEHVRVWFAPEDIEGGKKLHEQIDSAIQVHDKLLVILSPNSMGSEWVRTELRKARKTEIKEGRRKLFPIRLVDFDTIGKWECFDADSGKDLAVEFREYFIPDFSRWESHKQFEAAFKKLLKDLRASESEGKQQSE